MYDKVTDIQQRRDAAPHFRWWDDMGYGYLHFEPDEQFLDYFDRFRQRDDTDIGARLTEARIDLVGKYAGECMAIMDCGVGGGRFVKEMDCLGYDVSPEAVTWLKSEARYADMYDGCKTDIICFWDCIEHIHNLTRAVDCVGELLFASLPVFRHREHALASKHFRPFEHHWYFTEWGFVKTMDEMGFQLVEFNRMEEELGREDIGTFVFRRRHHGKSKMGSQAGGVAEGHPC
tara:strand:+ start:945 stop:1640 length:696 start_codon:yes stop_codon:yes gene_type:complete